MQPKMNWIRTCQAHSISSERLEPLAPLPLFRYRTIKAETHLLLVNIGGFQKVE